MKACTSRRRKGICRKAMGSYSREKNKKVKKKRDWTFWFILIVIVIFVVAVACVYVVKRNHTTQKTYIEIGEYEITELEYNYYYNTIYNSYVSTYSDYLEYFGLDTDEPLDEQEYLFDSSITWDDYFTEQTVYMLQEVKALTDDAEENDFEYDVSDDYEEYLETIDEYAETYGISKSYYYEEFYGDFASESTLETYVKEYLTYLAYYEELEDELVPTDEEIEEEYDSDPEQYDPIAYYVFDIYPEYEDEEDEDSDEDSDEDTTEDETTQDETSENETTEDETVEDETEVEETEEETESEEESEETEDEDSSEDESETEEDSDEEDSDEEEEEDEHTEEEIEAAMDEAEARAQEMLERFENGEDWRELCYEYAEEDMQEYYDPDEDDDITYVDDGTSLTISSKYFDWLNDDERVEGDTYLYRDDTNEVVYVIVFESKSEYDLEEDEDGIADTLASVMLSDYIEELVEDYEVTDDDEHLSYLYDDEDETDVEDETDTEDETSTETEEETDEDVEETDAEESEEESEETEESE